MMNYKHILEAINRGIQFALDDFESDKALNTKAKDKMIDKENSLWQNLQLREQLIDLGLPSGTLWCKYNLGVDPNQLSNQKDWYGNYYAWGELEGNKPKYDWKSYKFVNGYSGGLTKYCNKPDYEFNQFIDNLTELLPEDDAAYQNKKLYNYKFHMPTKEQFEELLAYTSNYWVKNYDPNKTIHNPKNDGGIKKLNGQVFEGKNGNQLFIPAAGYRDGSTIDFANSYCVLWSSSLCLDHSNSAHYLCIGSDDINIYTNYRYFGYSIRPVINL